MNVLFFLRYFRDQASSRVRGFDMADELKRRGVKCAVIHGYGKRVYMNFMVNLPRYEVVYFQKRYTPVDIKLNRIARMLGRKTIFDMDDHPAGVNLSPAKGRRAEEMMRLSSAVVGGCRNLVALASGFNKRVYLVPSPVSLRYYRPENGGECRDRVTLGWVGNGINYKKDLEMLLKPLESLGERSRIKLKLIGALGQKEIYDNFGKLRNVPVEIIDWVSSADPLTVPKLISEFDIGLYPLLDHEYNKYKCSLKALEYMAMKVPVIASPVGENSIVIEHGKDGYLPANETEWEEGMKLLIEDEDLRARMGEMGRKKIEERYSTEVCATTLLKVLKSLRGSSH